MRLPIGHYRVSHLSLPLFLLTLTTTSLAITQTQLQYTFNFHDPADAAPGGCDRDALIGKPMAAHVLASATDAFQMATKIQQNIGSYMYESTFLDRMRRCLFLFFGIKFQDDHQLSPDSVGNFIYVQQTFEKVTDFLNKPAPLPIDRPWLHCLEDYARYTVYGVQDPSVLAAQYCGATMPNGQLFPGMMYADFLTPYSPQPVNYYYNPPLNNIHGGKCSVNQAFTFSGPQTIKGLWGITLCDKNFQLPTFSDFVNIPRPPEPIEAINLLSQTAGVTFLHEMFHLFGPEIIDQPRLDPPNRLYPTVVDLRAIDWSLWKLNATRKSYGFTNALFLGLARPDLALLNAENYAMFALCMTLLFLECTDSVSVTNSKRANVPIQAAPERVNKSGESGPVWPSGFGKEGKSMSALRFTKEELGADYL